MMKQHIGLSRVYRFSAAHRLHSDKLDDQTNFEVYDKCNNINGHGHDYTVELTLVGIPDPETGMIIPLEEFDQKAKAILGELDYRHLNKEVAYFREHLSTGEIIIQYLWDRFSEAFADHILHHLKIWETGNNYFEIHRGGEQNK